MSKPFVVLRGGKVVYKPGHYDEEGATKVAKIESKQHPRAVVSIARIVSQYKGVK